MECQKTYGFTLVELSIVLVIIGIIVGGITAGKSLIKAGELRAVVSEMNGYKMAVNVFYLQYDGLPGDISNAYSYWPSEGCTDSVVKIGNLDGCNGDNDGQIDSAILTNPGGGEELRAWQQLALSGIISGNYSGKNLSTWQIGTDVPSAKIDGGSYRILFHDNYNWVDLLGDNPAAWFSPILSPSDTHNIDLKMDDGVPHKGHVRAIWNDGCYTTIPTTRYYLENSSIACGLSLQAFLK